MKIFLNEKLNYEQTLSLKWPIGALQTVQNVHNALQHKQSNFYCTSESIKDHSKNMPGSYTRARLHVFYMTLVPACQIIVFAPVQSRLV